MDHDGLEDLVFVQEPSERLPLLVQDQLALLALLGLFAPRRGQGTLGPELDRTDDSLDYRNAVGRALRHAERHFGGPWKDIAKDQ